MSYLRYGSVFRYVDGESKDYIFRASTATNSPSKTDYMEDYGGISNEGLVELIAQQLLDDVIGDTDDRRTFLSRYLVRMLADTLKVKLRDKPLTREQEMELFFASARKFEKEHKDLYKKK